MMKHRTLPRLLCAVAALCTLLAPPAQAAPDTPQQVKCKALADRIDRYDTQARRLQSAKRQDQLTEQRRKAREAQADLKC